MKKIDIVLLLVILMLTLAPVAAVYYNSSLFAEIVDVPNFEYKTKIVSGNPDDILLHAIENQFFQEVNPRSLFCAINGERILRMRETEDGKGGRYFTVTQYDYCGNMIIEQSYECCEKDRVTLFETTSDNGYIIRLEKVPDDMQDTGSQICNITLLKCDSNGNVEWTWQENYVHFEEYQFFVETANYYVFAGSHIMDEMDKTDIRLIEFTKEGEYVNETTLFGSDNDEIDWIRFESSMVMFGFCTWSTDGDFAVEDDSREYKACYYGYGVVDENLGDLRILWNKISMADSSIKGYYKGKEVTNKDTLLQGFEYGYPLLVLGYNDEYLVVSKVSINGYYSYDQLTYAIVNGYKMVYTLFDKEGKVIWQVEDT